MSSIEGYCRLITMLALALFTCLSNGVPANLNETILGERGRTLLSNIGATEVNVERHLFSHLTQNQIFMTVCQWSFFLRYWEH